jgi:serine/threonine-protein kinase
VGSTATTEPAASSADPALPVGAEAGEYRIEAAIGKGGFGTVYRAVHPVIGKQVAIKVLAHRFSADPAIVSRFQAEAKAVNQIKHRNIIDIFSFGRLADGRSYYVMEFLEGEPLDRVIAPGPMALSEAIPILRGLARALDAAHAKGIAHRDLKPENVFLARDPDGETYPKLLDFGIAKLLAPDPEADVRHHTGTGVPIGTPMYMSPEQCRGREVDHRTDVYSFGVMTYRMLTGAYPFTGDFMELMMQHTNEQPVPPSRHAPSLPPTVDDAIAWMMKKDPEQRPQSVLDAVVALDPRVPSTGPHRMPRPSQAPTIERGDRATALAATMLPSGKPRSRVRWIAALAISVAAATGIAWYVSSQHDSKTAPAPIATPEPAPARIEPPAPAPAPTAPAPTAPTVAPDPAPPTVVAKPAHHYRTTPAIDARVAEPAAGSEDDGRGAIIHLPHDSFAK